MIRVTSLDRPSLLPGSVALGCLLLSACGNSQPPVGNVDAYYDENSGKLSQLTLNAKTDGKPNIFSYMDGSRFVRIEIDADEDGRIDRWEYYSRDQALQKVGISSSDDGMADTWLYQDADGLTGKIEKSTKRDGKVDRTEYYAKGELARVEQDTDADGLADKWETYAAGALVAVSFDTARSGKPTITIDYGKTPARIR